MLFLVLQSPDQPLGTLLLLLLSALLFRVGRLLLLLLVDLEADAFVGTLIAQELGWRRVIGDGQGDGATEGVTTDVAAVNRLLFAEREERALCSRDVSASLFSFVSGHDRPCPVQVEDKELINQIVFVVAV